MADRVMIRSGRKIIFLRTNDIDYIEADRNYIRIHALGKFYTLRETLAGFQRKLSFDKLIRINRSVIVNIDRIKELQANESYKYQVVGEGNRSWSLGRKYYQNLKRLWL